jgi:hypothetical protein
MSIPEPCSQFPHVGIRIFVDVPGGRGWQAARCPFGRLQEELVTCTDQDPQHWTAVPVNGGSYIVEDGNGNCLGVKGGSTALGAPVEFGGCNPGPGQAAQEWTPLGAVPGDVNGSYQLVNANDGLCLGIFTGATAVGSLAVQWTCQASSPNQQWFGPWIFGTVTNQGFAQCMGVAGGATSVGAEIVTFACLNHPDQAWERDQLTGRIQDSLDGLCLSASTAAGNQLVTQQTCTGAAGESWEFEDFVGGEAELVNVFTGMCVTAPAAGQQLQTQMCSHIGTNQRWAFAVS